jgi:hypothetical protein
MSEVPTQRHLSVVLLEVFVDRRRIGVANNKMESVADNPEKSAKARGQPLERDSRMPRRRIVGHRRPIVLNSQQEMTTLRKHKARKSDITREGDQWRRAFVLSR